MGPSFFTPIIHGWIVPRQESRCIWQRFRAKAATEKGHGEHGKIFFCVLRVLSSVAIFFSQNGAEKTRKLAIVITEKEWTVSSTNQGL